MKLLLFVVDTTRLLVAAPLFLNKQSVASLHLSGLTRFWLLNSRFLGSLLDMVLRPKGQKRRKNAKGRRVTADDILECEGGRLDP